MDLCLILEDDLAELVNERGEVVWSSDDSEFPMRDYDASTPSEDVVAHVVRAGVVDSEDDIGEITIDRAGDLSSEGDFDDGDDDDNIDEGDDDD